MEYEEITKRIKLILRNEKAIRQAVAEKRASFAVHEETVGRAPGHISKPTEIAALQNLTPIEFVYFRSGWRKEKIRLDYPEKWLECIDRVRGSLRPWDRKFMNLAFTSQDWRVCSELGTSRRAFYTMKTEIVSKVAVKAASAGLIEV